MKTEQIIEHELNNFMDCFYGHLIKEGMYEQMPEELKSLFAGVASDDIAYVLDGVEERYFADYTYFRSEKYGNEVYWAIPYGEIEIPAEDIDADCIEDWCINGEFAYYNINAITIVYNIDKVKEAIAGFRL